jgi:predicted metal-dependent hydrolase
VRHPLKIAKLQLSSSPTEVPIHFARNPKARRYIMRMRDGVAHVTLPRGGTLDEAAKFVERSRAWLEKQLAKQPRQWTNGTTILLRGEPVTINVESNATTTRVRFGPHEFVLPEVPTDLRLHIEGFLARLAFRELIPRPAELAALHNIPIKRVVVRNQRSRWGSCSARGTISLNWRLIQTPPLVQDYIIIHELMHMREMNHSPRFWAHVAAAFPEYLLAEKWLRKNSCLLR